MLFIINLQQKQNECKSKQHEYVTFKIDMWKYLRGSAYFDYF